jgi:lipoprotein-anchoring transpeptidase ErfK/SrfK
VRAYQRRAGLPVNGEINAATRSHLNLDSPPTNHYLVTGEDLARLRPPARSWLEKSKRDRLDFETLLELVAEKSQAHPRLLSELNPGVAWASLTPGSVVRVPAVERPSPAKAAFFRISLSQRTLEAFDRSTNLLGHFPCSIASRVEKRPVGQLRVWVVVENPNYRFDPALFSDSPEARRIGRQLLIPPGPNNPVGTAWIGLSRPGYGIHGTPSPESVGRTESRGCFRLANWNADYVLKMAWVGLPVMVDP